MEDSFALLEEKVQKAADLVKRLRKENRTLGEEAARLTASREEAVKRIAALQKEQADTQQHAGEVEGLRGEVGRLQHERGEVRNRIAKLLELLAGLD